MQTLCPVGDAPTAKEPFNCVRFPVNNLCKASTHQQCTIQGARQSAQNKDMLLKVCVCGFVAVDFACCYSLCSGFTDSVRVYVRICDHSCA